MAGGGSGLRGRWQLLAGGAIAAATCLVATQHGAAHTPHDSSANLTLSVAFASDHTVIATVNGELVRSTDTILQLPDAFPL